MDHARQSSNRPTPIRLLTALFLALLLVSVAGCRSTAAGGAAPAGAPAVGAQSSSGPASDTRICGTPPCMRYVSRSETKTIADTVGAHPFISGVAMHAMVGLLCGGILCILGEGISVSYVGEAAKQAAASNECLRVRILPNGREWHLVDVMPSSQSPYCTN